MAACVYLTTTQTDIPRELRNVIFTNTDLSITTKDLATMGLLDLIAAGGAAITLNRNGPPTAPATTENAPRQKPSPINDDDDDKPPENPNQMASQQTNQANQSLGIQSDWPKLSGILRDATRGKGNFGLGDATDQQAEAAGKAWVGDNARVASDGRTLVSQDGLRQYRPPSYKPRLGYSQANFESRDIPKGQWQSNGHLNIVGNP